MTKNFDMRQSSKHDFEAICSLINQNVPFTYIRFSDGEMEVIFNSKLIISEGVVEWRGGRNAASYPAFDNKSFIPERDVGFRNDLIEAASFRAPNFIKGIRTRGNLGSRDKAKMLELNGGKPEGLTFSDLLMNVNWRAFIDQMVPLILDRGAVTFFGNFRAKPEVLSNQINHLKIGDDFIPDYDIVLNNAMEELLKLPKGSTVLSSASSLTNIVGHKLFIARPDLTLIDIGTALNPFIGLQDGLREYHSQSLPWTIRNLKKKSLYYIFGSHRMKW
jgi:hypothetical protein